MWFLQCRLNHKVNLAWTNKSLPIVTLPPYIFNSCIVFIMATRLKLTILLVLQQCFVIFKMTDGKIKWDQVTVQRSSDFVMYYVLCILLHFNSKIGANSAFFLGNTTFYKCIWFKQFVKFLTKYKCFACFDLLVINKS